MAGQKSCKVIPAETPLPRIKRVGIYCRVSSSNAAQLSSMSQQISYLTQLASRRPDWKLMDTYIDFESGNEACNRSEYQRMPADCQNGNLDIILTRTVSGFGRNA